MNHLVLSIDHRAEGNATHRTLKLDGDGVSVRCEFHLPGLELPPPRCLDGFLIGILFRLLSGRRPVHVDGALTKTCLRNVTELQGAWSLWRPGKYAPFPITARELIDTDLPSIKSAVCAFSGGVDSGFSLVRHAGKLLGEASLPVRSAVLVHGFDIPFSNTESFERIAARCRSNVEPFGIDLITIRTNIREESRQRWDDSYAAQLACCLHQLDGIADGAVIGSAHSYDMQVFPQGSTPATDHRLGGGIFSIFNDGATHSKTAKVATIAKYPELTRTLRFCWEGKDPEANCGSCEKCLRTYVHLRAVGVDNPECMPIPSLEQLAHIPTPSPALLNQIRRALDYARAHDRNGEWLRAAERSVRAYDNALRLKSVKSELGGLPYLGPLLRGVYRVGKTFAGMAVRP
jgi:hypothetical protein